jgi:hypothetical protein
VDAQHGHGVGRHRRLVVAQPRPVRRSHLDQAEARGREDVRHAKAAADLDQLAPRHQHLAAAQRAEGEQHAPRVRVDGAPRLRAGQGAQMRGDVLLA